MLKTVFFLLLVPALLFAGGQKEDSAYPEDQTVYRINNIDIQVDGKTKPFAIKAAGNIISGTIIYGSENLETYIAEKKQFLINLRTFEESNLEYTLGEADEHNQIPVDMFISVKDTSNLIIIPYPEYDSNEGFSLSLSTRDYNFFGTLAPLELDVGYELDTEQNSGFILESELLLPFELWGYIWTLDFANNLQYKENAPVYYDNHIGLLMDVPLNRTSLTFGLYESVSINEEFNPAVLPPEETNKHDKAAGGKDSRNIWYMNTTGLVRWNIPTGLEVFDFGELTYTPELDFSINYRPDGGDIGDSRRRGFEMSMKQTLDFGKVDWEGNFREGLTAFIHNSNTYNFRSGNWNNALFVTGIYHKIFTDYTAFSGRIRWAQWFQNAYNSAGYILRGIPDENAAADFMLSINLQEAFYLFRFLPSKWFNNPKLRFFDFEQHITPFIDAALVQDPLHKRSFSFDDMLFAAGVEFTMYPFHFNSAYLRISFGVDMRELIKTGSFPDDKHRELYVGMGHYF